MKLIIKILLVCLLLIPVGSTILANSLPVNESIVLTPENTLNLRGVVTSESVQMWQLQLLGQIIQRGDQDYTIYLVIDSPGGEIDSGIQFIEFAKKYPNIKTISIFAASMASAIVEGLPGERLITDNGVLMFHRARGGFQGQFNMGEIESQLALAQAVVTSMEQKNADRIGISLQDYRAHAIVEWWLFAHDAVAGKAADRSVDIVCSRELVEQLEIVLSPESGPLKFDRCPLMRLPLLEEASQGDE